MSQAVETDAEKLEATLALRSGGLRFEVPETERAYRSWALDEGASFVFGGMLAACGGWVFGLAALWWAFPQTQSWVVNVALVVLPSLPFYVAAARMRWRKPLFAVASLGNGLSGFIITDGLTKGIPLQVVVATIVLVTFTGLAAHRLPLRWGVPTALAYNLLFIAATWTSDATAHLGTNEKVMATTLVLVGALIGGVVAAVLERTSRWSFRQEQLLAGQRVIIEKMLRQEISHQVAERSKQLTEALANVDAALPPVRLEPEQIFAGRYKVLKNVGAGGMGAVFEVQRLTDGERLALKVVTGSMTGPQAARFAREAEIGSRLRHPNLVQIVDVGVTAAGAPWLVMELVAGGSLADAKERFGQRTWAVPVLRQILEGLNALHSATVVHRDLKPANVLLSGDPGTPRVHISDFGISSMGQNESEDPLADTAELAQGLQGQSLTRTGVLVGTPLYMAPETVRGAQAMGTASDVLAFGVVAYELLSGRLPFVVSPALEVRAGRPAPVASPLARGGPLGELVMACLHSEPERRPSVSRLLEETRA